MESVGYDAKVLGDGRKCSAERPLAVFGHPFLACLLRVVRSETIQLNNSC
jgi:hypothetical protein